MLYIVIIVLALACVVLYLMWQNVTKALAKERKDRDDLLNHYQRRVDEQERAQSDFRELQKNFESVGEGYDQALLMYDKMQEESDKLKSVNDTLQQQNAGLQKDLSEARDIIAKAQECVQQTVAAIAKEKGTLAATAASAKGMRNIGLQMRSLQNIVDMKDDRPISKNDNVMMMQIADQAIADSGIKETSYLQFETKTEGGAEATMVFANVEEAARVITLLLDNAMKFVTEGSVILRAVADVDNSQVRYEVEDAGTGIPAEEAEHIFEPFVKLNSFFDGQGLGLTVARNLARRMGGDVTLDTNYTAGARFVFTMPM